MFYPIDSSQTFGQTGVLQYVLFQENRYIYSQMVFTSGLTTKFRYCKYKTQFWKHFGIWIYGHFSAGFCQKSLMKL